MRVFSVCKWCVNRRQKDARVSGHFVKYLELAWIDVLPRMAQLLPPRLLEVRFRAWCQRSAIACMTVRNIASGGSSDGFQKRHGCSWG
jgi:hypothetical protein